MSLVVVMVIGGEELVFHGRSWLGSDLVSAARMLPSI